MNEIVPQPPNASFASPSVYTDRRALSEAWYRALFHPRATAQPPAANGRNRPELVAGAAAALRAAPARAGAQTGASPNAFAQRALRMRLVSSAPALSPALPARKQRVTATLRPAAGAIVRKRIHCRARLGDGTGVDLLVQQHGTVLRLIAIYDGRNSPRVAAALDAARAALLRRGVRIEIDAIQKGHS
ncbi:MAG: hypothetical protein ABSB70_04460 [Candidatus Velthaea sp.]